jgi:hypothetical protein
MGGHGMGAIVLGCYEIHWIHSEYSIVGGRHNIAKRCNVIVSVQQDKA